MRQVSPHIMVIDPGVHTPEIDTFNLIASLSPIPCHYHLPAMFGFESFPDKLDHVRGIIILGSAASVHDNLPWQRPLETWLQPAIELGIPILGCCYGHQMLAHMFGGAVEYISPERTKLKGVRLVRIMNNAVWPVGQRRLVVTHAEAVTRLPDCLRVLAKSDEIEIDGFMHENKPIFGLQSHPEATRIFLDGHEIPVALGVDPLSDGQELIRVFVHTAVGNRP
jgi:GMP synthase (glutamine-hydrolysing)